ncbi:MAG: electron transfer flavoprotein subunit alpha, partial [Anaerolineales bacterium]|nr:electron transfer flavoprotein subunit alpha [Anaerolineales bacterium]
MTNNDIWVFVEQEEGKIAEVSLELLAKGQELARKLNSATCGVICGHHIESLAESLIQNGADRVLLADHPELENYRTLPYARVASDLARARRPYAFLLGASPIGRDLAPRIASALRVGLTADCTDLQIGDFESKKEKQVYSDLLYQIRPAFGGNVIATIVNPHTRPQMATVREGVMRRRDPDT